MQQRCYCTSLLCGKEVGMFRFLRRINANAALFSGDYVDVRMFYVLTPSHASRLLMTWIALKLPHMYRKMLTRSQSQHTIILILTIQKKKSARIMQFLFCKTEE